MTSLPASDSPPIALTRAPKVAVVIPCFRVREKVVAVVESLIGRVDYIFAVDDQCPEQSGQWLQQQCRHPALRVLFHEINQGVGGAMITGYEAALQTDAEVIVKMDGDGQMDARFLARLIAPLLSGKADFAKGNRFFDLRALRAMPQGRRIGNFGLTLLTKAASGFWHLSDPTNGYFALRRGALGLVNFHLLDRRYFFEISLLVQLNVIRAVAIDVPIPAIYADENSSLDPVKALFSFPTKLLRGFMHRIWWRYFIYDINIVSIFLVTGLLLFLGGAIFGAWRWSANVEEGANQSAGTVALAMLPMLLGFQMLLQAMVLDVMDKPGQPVSEVLEAGEAKE